MASADGAVIYAVYESFQFAFYARKAEEIIEPFDGVSDREIRKLLLRDREVFRMWHQEYRERLLNTLILPGCLDT